MLQALFQKGKTGIYSIEFFSYLCNLQIQSKFHHNNKEMFGYDKTLGHYNDYHYGI
jgi:hypothetical protein